MDLLAAAKQGFETVDADPAFRAKAVQFLEQWLSGGDFTPYRPQIEWLVTASKWADLLDMFYQVLPFGTGGRRGAVGIGPNRMNLWTLGASVQGHSEFLKARFPGKTDLKVALAYDVRQFEDKRKVYNPALPNPVLHLSSKDFAKFAACVYAANGIHSHILPDDSNRYLATPELSFAIRFLGAQGGLNVSASHNPPDDNGGKFYEERGGQPVPPDDQIMSDYVDQVKTIRSMPWAEAVRGGKVHFLDDSSHKAYIGLCAKQSITAPPTKADDFRLVYTPLHGVGSMTALEALQAVGFKPFTVAEQMPPNGQFPNVTKSPNPEVPESMDRGEAEAKTQKAHLVIATDPDADRIGGVASRSLEGGGEFRFLTGQEICAMITHFKLSQLARSGDMPPSPVVVTTEVTTSMVGRIARSFNVQIVENLLVGFKYIAEVIWQLESTGHYEDVSGTTSDFLLGCEESHGLQTTAELRDKDAGGAAVLVAEMALEQKRQGRTVPEYLDSLARQYGYFRNEVLNIIMTGIEGKSNMGRMLDALRKTPPKTISGVAVTGFEDLRDENGRMGPLKGATDASSRNFLIFRLGDIGKVVLRPSGTEPKAKAYLEVRSAPWKPGTTAEAWDAACREIDVQVQKIATDFLTMALATVGQKPAAGGDKLSR
ncbi:phospho-sugar mutase [Zavarzinella formosa]|uniref:phospho-sugar mutase n=1 Tax=Zavarzinella formosa TaxID=360055 RepID=UPI0002FC4BAC|nr:phospho-sugar mutase [Zavarzinella formosa]